MFNTYDRENPKFRKAFIRDRLDAIKAERLTLIGERDRLEEIERDREAKAHSRSVDRRPANESASASASGLRRFIQSASR